MKRRLAGTKMRGDGFFLFVLLAALLFLLLSPYAYRVFFAGTPLLFGEETYYHLRIARQIMHGTIPASDTLVYNARPYFFGPFHVVLAYSSALFGLEIASVLLPVLLGVLSLFFFYLVIGKYGISGAKRAVICALLIASPAFISTFSQPNPHALAILLYLSGFYALLQSGPRLVGFLLLIATLLFGLFNAFLLFVMLLAHYTVHDRKKIALLSVFFLIFISAAAYYLLGLSASIPVSSFGRMVSDVGGDGFGIFTFILLSAGLVFSWRERYSYILPYCLLLFLSTYVFFNSGFAIPYLGFVVAVFSGLGLYRIATAGWSLPVVKRLTMLVILCGLAFSTVSYVGRLANSEPGPEVVSTLSWLSEQEPGLVFSHFSNGFWIEYFADKPVLLDGFLVSDLRSRYRDMQEILYSRNIERTSRLLEKYDAKYIYIDESMKKGKVWWNDDEGLLFVLRNREYFRKVYDTRKAQIWEYRGQK